MFPFCLLCTHAILNKVFIVRIRPEKTSQSKSQFELFTVDSTTRRSFTRTWLDLTSLVNLATQSSAFSAVESIIFFCDLACKIRFCVLVCDKDLYSFQNLYIYINSYFIFTSFSWQVFFLLKVFFGGFQKWDSWPLFQGLKLVCI